MIEENFYSETAFIIIVECDGSRFYFLLVMKPQ
jgi:hypothetical protein